VGVVTWWGVVAITFNRDGTVRQSTDAGETQDYGHMIELAEQGARRLGCAEILCDGAHWGHIKAVPDDRGAAYPKVLIRGGNGWAADELAAEASRRDAALHAYPYESGPSDVAGYL
jgi:hypothetical protein